MPRLSRWMPIGSLCVMLAITASCAKKTETANDTYGSSQTPTASAVKVTNVDLGKSLGPDARVTDKTSVFNPNDEVYAVVVTSGTAPSATLKTRWTFQDGQVVDESERMIAPTGDAATEFHVSKPDGLPAGKYRVEVFLDGTPVQAVDFEVKPA